MLRNLYPSIDYDESFQLWNWGNYISRIKILGMLLHLLKLMEELYWTYLGMFLHLGTSFVHIHKIGPT